MGVERFYSWIRNKNYTGVLNRSVPKYVSSFSLDMNGIIHKVAQIVYAYGEGKNEARSRLIKKTDSKQLEAEFHHVLSIKLLEVISQVQPVEILVLAVDGVAPQAKISQQRQRRFRSAMEREPGMIFDSSSISPGTEFMRNLDSFLQRWIVSQQQSLPPKIIYSSHLVPGEGEHKILDLMRSGEIIGDGAHVLYGMDADLIMLSMLSPLNKIHLMREDIRDVINIDNLKYNVDQEYGGPTAIEDFVIITFTIGNDFLPHMPALEDLEEAMDTMLDVYRETKLSLIVDKEINWENLAVFLTNLGKQEYKLLEHESRQDVKYPSRMIEVATTRSQRIEERGTMDIGAKITFESKFDYNVFRGAWYQNAFGLRGSSDDQAVFAKLLPGYKFGVNPSKVVHMCQDYLTGIGWVYNYYSKGIIRINASYIYRYHHTPLLSDLAAVLSQTEEVTGYMAATEQIVLNPIHQLLAVLPLKSKALLPIEVQHLMESNSPISDMYPETAIIERDGKNREWQGTVIIPFVNAQRIIDATPIFSIERGKLFEQANTVVLMVEPDVRQMLDTQKQFRQVLDRELYNKYRGRGRGRGKNKGRGRGGNKRQTGRGRSKNNRNNRSKFNK